MPLSSLQAMAGIYGAARSPTEFLRVLQSLQGRHAPAEAARTLQDVLGDVQLLACRRPGEGGLASTPSQRVQRYEAGRRRPDDRDTRDPLPDRQPAAVRVEPGTRAGKAIREVLQRGALAPRRRPARHSRTDAHRGSPGSDTGRPEHAARTGLSPGGERLLRASRRNRVYRQPGSLSRLHRGDVPVVVLVALGGACSLHTLVPVQPHLGESRGSRRPHRPGTHPRAALHRQHAPGDGVHRLAPGEDLDQVCRSRRAGVRHVALRRGRHCRSCLRRGEPAAPRRVR